MRPTGNWGVLSRAIIDMRNKIQELETGSIASEYAVYYEQRTAEEKTASMSGSPPKNATAADTKPENVIKKDSETGATNATNSSAVTVAPALTFGVPKTAGSSVLPASSPLFGTPRATQARGMFGVRPASETTDGAQPGPISTGLFGTGPAPSGTSGLFGSVNINNCQKGLFGSS